MLLSAWAGPVAQVVNAARSLFPIPGAQPCSLELTHIDLGMTVSALRQRWTDFRKMQRRLRGVSNNRLDLRVGGPDPGNL